MKKGVFITFEGGEGTGKSTQTRLLANFLESRGHSCVLTREPGGSDGAEEIRNLVVKGAVGRWDAMTEALLMFAARRDHLVHTIWKALDEGKTVICDRFADSTMAYQGYGYADKGLGPQIVQTLYDTVVGDFKPDLTIVMDMPVEVGLKRALKRDANSNRYERMGLDFHHNLRQAFLTIAEQNPDRCAVVDATGSIEDIQQAVQDIVLSRLITGEK